MAVADSDLTAVDTTFAAIAAGAKPSRPGVLNVVINEINVESYTVDQRPRPKLLLTLRPTFCFITPRASWKIRC